MVSLAELKKKSSNNLTKLVEAAKKETSKGYSNDDNRFWTIKRDKNGNGSAVIRFLPIPEVDSDKSEAVSWVKKWSYGFKSEVTGNWYIEDSRTTINQPDPVYKLNKMLYARGDEEQAKKQKRTLSYYSNIYVVRDPANPENEGKVFLFRYGKKLFEKISAFLSPDESLGEQPEDVFSFWEGRDFKLKVKSNEQGYPNYDTSEFGAVSVIHNRDGVELTDEEIDEIYKKEYSLLEIIDPSKFKSYEDLEKRLKYVLGEIEDLDSDESSEKTETKKEPKAEKEVSTKKEKPKEEPKEMSVDDDIDIDSLLESL